jgi:alkyldihydroxyacetonephosphate synthase
LRNLPDQQRGDPGQQGAGDAPLPGDPARPRLRNRASLYFTVVCVRADDPLAQWAAAKSAANAAIRAAGAAITHHHGVGVDHRGTYHREIGPLAVEALRAVKKTLDPQGILNPGVLL